LWKPFTPFAERIIKKPHPTSPKERGLIILRMIYGDVPGLKFIKFEILKNNVALSSSPPFRGI
jgi:hypothetical protein